MGIKISLAVLLASLLLTAILMTAGCAGPATPLGAPWATNAQDAKGSPQAFLPDMFHGKGDAQIRFSPAHQNLHTKSPISVEVRDTTGIRPNFKLVVRHNGID